MEHTLQYVFWAACLKPFSVPPEGFSKRPRIQYELVPKETNSFSNGISKPFIVKTGGI